MKKAIVVIIFVLLLLVGCEDDPYINFDEPISPVVEPTATMVNTKKVEYEIICIYELNGFCLWHEWQEK